MGVEKYANDIATTTTEALDNSELGVDVTSVTGFPAVPFRIRIDDELMLVTAVASLTFTVTRGIEGTSAVSHLTGADVVHVLTERGLKNASGIREIYRSFATSADAHSPHETSNTAISDMSVTFTLDEARDVLITFCYYAEKSGGGTALQIYDGGSIISPANTAQFWADHRNTQSNLQVSVSFIINLSAASHTITVKEQALGNTNAITFYDRSLTCEVLSDQ